MNSTKWNKYLLGLAIVALVGTIFFAVKINPSYALKSECDQIIRSVAQLIKDNPKLLSQSTKSVEDFNYVEGDAVAWVNDLPITKEEFDLRKGLKKMTGDKVQDDQSVFNILVEEKMILDYAIKNKIVPTDAQLQEFINFERNSNQTGEEYQEMVQEFCKQAGMTEDEYYNTYEKYNAFRVLLLKNAYEYALEEGQRNGSLTLDKDKDVTIQQAEKNKYWHDTKKVMKESVTVKVNEKYKDLNLIVDTAKIYK